MVIADYSMPHFSGLARLRCCRIRNSTCLSSWSPAAPARDVAVAAIGAGARYYILKGNLARLAPAVERELRDAKLRRDAGTRGIALPQSLQ